MGIFATVYVFDTDVSQKMQIQQKIETAYRKDRKSFFQNEPLPPEKYWALPFNLMIKGQQLATRRSSIRILEKRTFVACHKIYGNIKVNSLATSDSS